MGQTRYTLSRRTVLSVGARGLAYGVLLSLLPTSAARALQRKRSLSWQPEADALVRKIGLPVFPARTLVVTELSHKNNRALDARSHIQRSIDEVARQGGGRVVVPPGEWFIKGPIRLVSHVELHLPEGSRLTFSDDPDDYLPPVFTRWEGTEVMSLSPLIYVCDAENVAVTGKGMISGNGRSARQRGMVQRGIDQDRLREMGDEGVPVAERVFGKGRVLPPSLMQFQRCRSVLVEGVTIIDMPLWGVHLLYSRDITVRGISVNSRSANNDGIDIDSSEMVNVDQCTFVTGDDCIAVKSGRDRDGRVVGRPSSDVVIQNCHMQFGQSAGVAIGSEMSGGVKNVYILRCKMDRVGTALNIKSNRDRGGYVEHIRLGNTVVDVCDTLVGVTTTYHSYRGGHFVAQMRDILVEDVWCQNAHRGLAILGDSDGPIEGFSASALRVDSVKTPVELKDVRSMALSDVTMNGVEVK